MKACPRDHFIPEAHREEAFTDSPVRLEALDFNVSAPHMHASCLEALHLQPGHRLLDVGTGCGIIVACAAHIVSPSPHSSAPIRACMHASCLQGFVGTGCGIVVACAALFASHWVCCPQ